MASKTLISLSRAITLNQSPNVLSLAPSLLQTEVRTLQCNSRISMEDCLSVSSKTSIEAVFSFCSISRKRNIWSDMVFLFRR